MGQQLLCLRCYYQLVYLVYYFCFMRKRLNCYCLFITYPIIVITIFICINIHFISIIIPQTYLGHRTTVTSSTKLYIIMTRLIQGYADSVVFIFKIRLILYKIVINYLVSPFFCVIYSFI